MTRVNVILVQHSLVNNTFLETIAAHDGEAQHLTYHQERLNRALQNSSLYDLKMLLDVPSNKLTRCRVVYNSQEIKIEYLPYTPRDITSLQLVQANDLIYNHKYADRTALDQLTSKRHGADDVLIVQDGYITDTSIANIAFYDGETWYTPTKPLLEGTTRARLIDEKQLIIRPIKVDDLKHYQGFALLNAMIGFQAIKNGIILPLKDL